MIFESKEAAKKAAWLVLLGGAVRTERVCWLSGPEESVAAENKLVQLAAAFQLGIKTPKTLVTTDESLVTRLSRSVVAKPLGPGDYVDETGAGRAVFTTSINKSQLSGMGIARAPFIFQEAIRARTHYRIVTVGERVWGAALVAAGLPIDWRSDENAHHSFEVAEIPSPLAGDALELCRALGVRFSSQDWIVDGAGSSNFLDFNPAGQWLFLPHEVFRRCGRCSRRLAFGQCIRDLRTAARG